LYLSFDGDIEDHSESGLRTIPRGYYSADFAPGVRGQSKIFDGLEAEISVPGVGDLPITDDFTLEFWMNAARNNPPDGTIASLGDLLVVRVNVDTGKMDVVLRTEESEPARLTGGNIKPAVWHHVALVYRGKEGEICLYLDGEQFDRMPAEVIQPFESKEPLRVGSLDPQQAFIGWICELRLYNVAFSGELVREHAKLPEKP
jgi:hypothetical protein